MNTYLMVSLPDDDGDPYGHGPSAPELYGPFLDADFAAAYADKIEAMNPGQRLLLTTTMPMAVQPADAGPTHDPEDRGELNAYSVSLWLGGEQYGPEEERHGWLPHEVAQGLINELTAIAISGNERPPAVYPTQYPLAPDDTLTTRLSVAHSEGVGEQVHVRYLGNLGD